MPATCAKEGGLALGERVGDRYELRRLLGSGGMGQVFEAYDHGLARLVALKTVHAGAPLRDGALLRLEAQALAAIRHPGIVPVHDVGSHRSFDYMVMELIPGISLEGHLEQQRKTRARFLASEAAAILKGIAEALTAVHGAGIAHRDVKPANVMLPPSRAPVLMDLGIFVAEIMLAGDDISGTPEYMAPEVIAGRVAPGAGHLVDIYALGVVGFEILTGEPPFQGNTPDILDQHLVIPPRSIAALRPDVPAELAALVDSCLAKDPQARPPSAEAVTWALKQLGTPAPRPATQPISVLIVEDNPDAAALMAECVKRVLDPVRVSVTAMAERALKLVRSKLPELILLDLRLPGMNGIELLMYMRGTSVAAETTIISVSGGAAAADIEFLHQLGVRRFVPKGPGLVDELTEALEEFRAVVRPVRRPSV